MIFNISLPNLCSYLTVTQAELEQHQEYRARIWQPATRRFSFIVASNSSFGSSVSHNICWWVWHESIDNKITHRWCIPFLFFVHNFALKPSFCLTEILLRPAILFRSSKKNRLKQKVKPANLPWLTNPMPLLYDSLKEFLQSACMNHAKFY